MVQFLIFVILLISQLKTSNALCLKAEQKQVLNDLKYVNNFINSVYNECPAYLMNDLSLSSTFQPMQQKTCATTADCSSDYACCDSTCKSKKK